MARHDPTELARGAYAAYGEATGGKNFRGDPMPAWEDLGSVIRHAWTEAARAVFQAVVTPPRSED